MADAPAFDPSKPFETVGGAPPFDPSKPFEAIGAPEGIGTSLARAVTDIPSEVYDAAAAGLHEMNAVNPWGAERTEARARGEPPSMLAVPRAAMGALSVAGAPITGAARSVGGHLLDLLNRGMRAGAVQIYGEDKVRQAEAATGLPVGGGSYETAKPDVDRLMMGLGPRGGMRPAAVPVPAAPRTGPLGVTLSEGQETGALPAIRREQAAARGQLGPAAEARAADFNAQQGQEIQTAADRIRAGFDPLEQVHATNPQEAAESASLALREAAAHTQALSEAEGAALAPNVPFAHPLDVADTVATSLRDARSAQGAAAQARDAQTVALREGIRNSLDPNGQVIARSPQEAADIISGAVGNQAENAQAATRAAYQQLRDLPGRFHPATFNRIGDTIRSELNAGTEPIRVNPQTTPIANSALGDLDEILGGIRQSRDARGRILPRDEPITPAVVDDTRKRLNTFLGDALAAARSSNNWSDVRAMRGIMNAFDDYVAGRLERGTFLGGDASGVLDTMRNAREIGRAHV